MYMSIISTKIIENINKTLLIKVLVNNFKLKLT
jgi:hypothetical protein